MKNSDIVLIPVVLIIVMCLPQTNARECQGMDIRNDIKNLDKLRGCSVIFGDLWIVLMEKPSNDFSKVSFPELREITGFLLFYRVVGLQDLGKLFPNLIVIRGAQVVGDYALVVYGLEDLRLIGLKNLISIERGFVRIEDCPQLCHASTVDWALITRNQTAGNVIQTDAEHCEDLSVACRTCAIPGKCWSRWNCQKIIGDGMTQCKNARQLENGGSGSICGAGGRSAGVQVADIERPRVADRRSIHQSIVGCEWTQSVQKTG